MLSVVMAQGGRLKVPSVLYIVARYIRIHYVIGTTPYSHIHTLTHRIDCVHTLTHIRIAYAYPTA